MADVFAQEEILYDLDIPKESRFLNTVSYDYSVEYLKSLVEKGKIILEVPFQRNHIWKNDKASSLIESIIMNVPIPPLYFAEEDNGDWLVLDGLQRLYSIKNYFDNEFSLQKLEVLKELEKLKYKDLPPKAKSLLNDGLLRVNVIRKDSHPSIKYDIFMRLNRGAVTLNYQELRNCLYRGNLNDAAKELCKENKTFMNILAQKAPHPRFLDVEFIIRFFALSDSISCDENGDAYLKDYRGKLVSFINDYMAKNKNCTPDQKKKYKRRFSETIEKVVTVFGEKAAFRDITTENSKVYKTIADFIMPSFERISFDYLYKNRDQINRILFDFLSNEEISDSLKIKTSDKDVMNLRVRNWFREFKDELQF